MRASLSLASSAALVAACSIGETTHETVVIAPRTRPETRTCESPFEEPDLSSLVVCGAGRGAKGHCYDGAKSPVAGLLACGGGDVCVPDAILEANGRKLASCTFFIGNAPGVCLSVLADDVFAHRDDLKRDVCGEDERCVPCVNPIDGKDTHTCDPIGVHESACVGGAGAAPRACCHGSGACIREDGTPEGSRGKLRRDVCPAEQVCAPAALVDGAPVKCDVLGVAGVCLDVCFASMLEPAGKLLRSSCGPTEVCLPCVVGKGQGMPGCD